MKNAWIFLLAVCVWCPVQGSYRLFSSCVCNGKALYCVRDFMGLRCENCLDNSEGRHCENCKEGFYHQRAGERCQPCYCNAVGSVGQGCNSQGQCVCKQGVQGSRCDQCANGAPITAQGCEPMRQNTCFCNGHSRECSLAQGYTVYSITSTFDQGTEDWQAVTAQTVNPSQVNFRWLPGHHNIEVISKDLLPVYLSAPAQYLGNQVLSYGQTLSFSLRLDRGVRYPSTSDVVLEGAGLKVSASLGNLRTVIPCGRKITYTFKLDEQPDSKWKPQLSSTEFQTLLSDLAAIKIRATFGENGRGYLDDVTLVSARLGSGTPASWVEKCRCPAGYDGDFCEYCAAGYKRRFPGQGRRSPCEPCTCRGGSCDPETGDCYPADETRNGEPCPIGQYENPRQPGSCLTCPCPTGYSCLVAPGTLDVICNCPPGITGSSCQRCNDGFYGDPLGERGMPQPCRRCQCNGHLDPNAVGNCDDFTGECLKCLNNTTGFFCENCLDGFYHSKPADACTACNCNPQGSLSRSCSDQGKCSCTEGFEGHKCERFKSSTCPSCFSPVKSQIEKFAQKLQELEAFFNSMGNGGVYDNKAMEKALSTAEELVQSMQKRADTLTDTEALLYAKLSLLRSTQLKEEGRLQDISRTVNNIASQDQQYTKDVAEIQKLILDIRQNLLKARQDMNQIDFPLRDAEAGINPLTSLVQKAADLAEQHQNEAGTVEQSANNAVSEAEKALAFVGPIITGENNLQPQISSLKNQFNADVALVNKMQKEATSVTDAAQAESKVALDSLKQISALGKTLTTAAPQVDITGLVAKLDNMKDLVKNNVTSYQELQKEILADKKETGDLLNKVKTAQQAQDKLLARANAAKAEADQAMKLFSTLGNVDEALDKLRGFEGKISSSKALADEALSKLPFISGTIQQAVASNAETQAVLGDLGNYKDALDSLDKLNNTLTRIEKMSASLPPSSDLLTTATTLKGGMEGLKAQADLTMDQLTKDKKDAERYRKLAEEVNRDANEVYKGAKDTRSAVTDTLTTVNNLLDLLGKPGSVDEKRVSDLERAIADSRSLVQKDLRPRLIELENKEIQQRAAIARMINDIDTIVMDIKNLEHIYENIPGGCYNTAPNERP
ncbi:laminin subunit gamma-2 [Pygocentrus nattereri]|uniref:Laminin subunit gamma 2 n=1 Tax=Pygocentrus nattereri TaxID=42514 RepID=A0A3B4BZP0_PYGNA|nr:laminin subunit gamma-2 [Pygocentrus nattereri]